MRRSSIPLWCALVALLGCPDGGEVPLVGQPTTPEFEFAVTAPVYGEFIGGGPAIVEGTVQPPQARVWVEGVQIHPASDGTFRAKVPMDHAYRILDVAASWNDRDDSERIPVFAGHDPADTWTEGLTGRVLPGGLARAGDLLGEVVDAAGWADLLAASLPALETDLISLLPVGITHEPTEVLLEPAEAAVAATLTFVDVVIAYELWITLGNSSFDVPMSVGFGQVAVTAQATPSMDENGIVSFALGGAGIALDEADLEIGPLEGWILEWVFDALNDWVVEPLADLLLEWVLAQYGTFELGGPFAFETDLLGFQIAAKLSSLFADLEGVAVGAGIGLGAPAPAEGPDMPIPGEDVAPGEQMVLALHEGMLDLLLSDSLLDLLDQDLDLSGALGELAGAAIVALPGGEDVPDGEGWCFSIWPGTAHVVRLQEGTEPLAVMYMPDLRMDVQREIDGVCENWLYASLAVEAGIVVEDGTKLSFDITMPEGAVLKYGADPDSWTEDEVIEGLGGFLNTILGLVGGMLEIDLADLLGGLGGGDPLGDLLAGLAPSIEDSVQMYDVEGAPIEGLFAVSLDLFAEGAGVAE